MLTEAAMVLAAVLQLGGDPEEVNNPPSSEGFRNETRSEAVYPGVSGGLGWVLHS